MTWTLRMIEVLTADAERCWVRFCGAAEPAKRRVWERRYNQRMRAVAYLRGRLQG